MESAAPRTLVLEFGMGVDVHGQDCTSRTVAENVIRRDISVGHGPRQQFG